MTPEQPENQPETTPAESKPVIPWHGSRYVIRSVVRQKVVNFWGGKVSLVPLEDSNPHAWECFEENGWLGFRDPASNLFLGRDVDGSIQCLPPEEISHKFCVRQHPGGKYVLLLKENFKLTPLGVSRTEEVVLFEDWIKDCILWEFIKLD